MPHVQCCYCHTIMDVKWQGNHAKCPEMDPRARKPDEPPMFEACECPVAFPGQVPTVDPRNSQGN